MWLKSTGIDPEWQDPFLDPVTIAFFVGRVDVESTAEKVWGELTASYIKPLYSKFPFQRQAEVEINPPELEKMIGPQGSFWKTFKDYLAPICVENAGHWTERVSPLGVFRIPAGMLGTVNELSKVTKSLWNDQGVAQAIVLEIRPSGLPPRTEHAPLAVLCYLRSDKSSVFAFNQQPAWQKMEVEWWKSQTSAVGAEFEAFQDGAKSYREVAVNEKFWSFYHLLNKAETKDKSVFLWRINGPAPYSQEVRAGFTMKSDPWTVFQINR